MTKAQKQWPKKKKKKEQVKQKDIFNTSSSFVETANKNEILRQQAHGCWLCSEKERDGRLHSWKVIMEMGNKLFAISLAHNELHLTLK